MLFAFDHLHKDVQEELVEKERAFLSQHEDFWGEGVREDFKRIAEILGVEVTDISYRLAYSRGDGASFEGNYYYAKGARRAIREYAPLDERLHEIADTLYRVQKRYFYQLSADISRPIGLYVHSKAMCMDVYRDGDKNVSAEDCIDVQDALRGLADWLYQTLLKEYEYAMSDECVRERLRDEGHVFTSEGERE